MREHHQSLERSQTDWASSQVLNTESVIKGQALNREEFLKGRMPQSMCREPSPHHREQPAPYLSNTLQALKEGLFPH